MASIKNGPDPKNGPAGKDADAAVSWPPPPPPPAAASTSYVPQFSQTTEMILQRIRSSSSTSNPNPTPKLVGNPVGNRVSSTSRHILPNIDPPTLATSAIKASPAYEETKRRLLQTMSTSAAMALPSHPAKPKPATTFPTASFLQPRTPTPGPKAHAPKAASPAGNTLPLPTPVVFPPSQHSIPGRPFKPSISPLSRVERQGKHTDLTPDFSDESDEAEQSTQVRATMTKSGRQVQKPTQFTVQHTPRRKGMGKRTEVHAMCSLCGRLAFTDDNQIVFCDSCNEASHQKCANPMIPKSVVASSDIPWYCARCQGRKLESIGHGDGLGSWPDIPPDQQCAYLSSLPQPMLVSLLTKSLALVPDLPVFPPLDGTAFLPEGPSSRAANGGPSRKSATANKDVKIDHNLMPELEGLLPWPKHGGLYAKLPPESEDPMMVDEDDYEAFSVIQYDKNGNKTWENGKPVSPQEGKAAARRS